MSPAVIALALTAAVMHASWNAFLRSGADRLWSITVMGVTGIAATLPLILFYFPLPASPVSASSHLIAIAGGL